MPENLTQLEDGRWLVIGDQLLPPAGSIPAVALWPGQAAVVVDNSLLSSLPEIVRLREEVERLREAVTPFVRHGSAIGVFGGYDGTIQVYTDSGFRSIPAEDFIRARSALSSDGGELVQQRGASDSPQCDHPVTEKTLGQIAYNAAKPHLPGAPVAWCDARMDAEWRQVWHTAAGAVRAVVIAECAKVVDRFSQEEHEGPVVHESLAIAFEEVASEIRSLASATTSRVGTDCTPPSPPTSGDRTASTPESPGLNHTSSDGGEG
jgi:hypothetical protein